MELIMQASKVAALDSKYDYLKLGLSVLVVAIHADLYPLILYPWLRIAVPLFFVMTSYFLFSKLQNAAMDVQGKMIKKFVLRNVALYCFWFVVLLPITLLARKDSYFSGGFVTGLWNFLRSLMFRSTFLASWYIPASVIGVLIIWALSRWTKHWVVVLVSTAAFCVVTLLSSYESVVLEYPIVSKAVNGYWLIFDDPVVSFPASLFWIMIGKCFAENRMKALKGAVNWVVFTVGALCLYLEWRIVRSLDGSVDNDSYFMLVPVCISLFAAIERARTISNKHSVYFRQASTLIYVSHNSVIFAIRYLIQYLQRRDSPPLVFVSALLICCTLYFVITFIQRRWKNAKISKLLKYAF